MCNLTKWHCSEDGYIFQCCDCRHFQVCFGTSILTLSEEEFRYFAEIVADRKENMPAYADMPCKCIILPTPSSNVQCVLTGAELIALHKMIHETEVEMMTSSMLQLFRSEK